MRRHLPLLLLAAAVAAFLPPEPTLAGGLTPDHRAGVVTALQGTALVRPVGRERWTPLDPRALLLPGDVVRTDARGAHALEVRLRRGARLVLGPGALLELPDADAVRLLAGEMEVRAAADAPLPVRGPGGYAREVSGEVALRAADGKTTELPAAPRWLQGYRASTSEEWMGSLLATVDGRDVPLAVGYHKVTVEIRDQIARTTVEESFVNATDATLEGVFSFPLPADASISGFGMWIGDELVEADLVERERAREIYEDILRRKKDPGLLEWEGGNLFKARVFPILPHAEKRIRLRYTQVLPLEGEVYRYRYALRSELLRLHPLRELGIRVSVLSTAPLRDVTSPTHEVTLRRTEHEAVVEYGAQEVSPDRDFEVAVSVGRGEGLSAVAHRRGEDGFFMLLLSPPDPEASGWQRDLLPEGDPVDLVLLADTSGSMDPAAREAQASFLGALLAQLSPKDRFRLVAFDVEPHALSGEPLPATPENAARALDWLDARFSLGWTDLPAALSSVLPCAAPGAHVVYVGDGIHTAGDPDPVAAASRVRALGQGTSCTWHAVSTSSAYEQVVLEAIASVGGGSMRRADEGAVAAARDLLGEVARPGVRDLRVEVRGLPTAKVYPAALPNLPLGRQQVVLGRFLPGPEVRSADVVVSGTLAGKPVRFASSFAVPAPEEGNSFLPRLWARRHLDALLAEGATPQTKEEVVAFSREYQIMTPYTSFLVLESDEDRERYGVERAIHMRDAERFFAEAKDRATLEIARRQSESARRWRTDLRRSMLREIAGLGRDLPIPDVAVGEGGEGPQGSANLPLAAEHYGAALESRLGFLADVEPEESLGESWGYDGGDLGGPFTAAPAAAPAAPALREEAKSEGRADGGPAEHDEEALEEELALDDAVAEEEQKATMGLERLRKGRAYAKKVAYGDEPELGLLFRTPRPRPAPPFGAADLGFPGLGSPPSDPPSEEDPPWDPKALAALRSLERRPAALTGAVRVETSAESLHPVQGRVLGRQASLGLQSPRRWFLRREAPTSETIEGWVSEEERGALHAARRLGRRRAAADGDRSLWAVPTDATLSVRSLARQYRRPPTVTVEGDVVRLAFRPDRDPWGETVYGIDAARGVLLETRTLREGRTTSLVRRGDLVEAAGLWWPTTVEALDEDGNVTYRERRRVEALAPDAFAAAFDAAVAGHGDVVFLGLAEPTAADAKQALRDGRAELPHHVALLLDAAAGRRWDDAFASLAAIEGLAPGRPGLPWIRLPLLVAGRRGTEVLAFARERARDLAASASAAAPWLAGWLDSAVRGALGARERLDLLEALRPAWEREGVPEAWPLHARRRRAAALEEAGAAAEARSIREAIASERPWEIESVLARVRDLQVLGDPEGAARYLAGRAAEARTWSRSEVERVHASWTEVLWAWRDLPGLSAAAASWLATRPRDSATPYQMDASLLWFRGRHAEGDAWVVERLGLPIGVLGDPTERRALEAATEIALGQGWNFHARRVEPAWRGPLADLALRLARSDTPAADRALRVLSDWRFRRTEEARAAWEALRADLLAEGAVASMPWPRLQRYVTWLEWGRDGADEASARRVVDGLLARWRATADPADADILADLADLVLRARKATEERVALLRERLARALPRDVPARALALVEGILEAPYDAAREDEAFALLDRAIDPKAAPDARRASAADLARRLAHRAFEGRQAALLGPPEARAAWTRAETVERTREARRRAREETAARLGAAAAAAPEVARPWLEVERLGYFAESRRDLLATEAQARELLDAVPATPRDDPCHRLLASRAALVLAYAASRREAPEGLADRVLALFRERLAADDPRWDVRYELFRLLVALDRVADLEVALAAWIRPGGVENRWRIALAYLQAETDRLRDAATTLEGAEGMDDLPPEVWSSLADWYLVLREDARRERALDRRYEAMPDWQLNQHLWNETNRTRRRGEGVPAELDPEALRALRILLRKASEPAHYVGHLQNLYGPTKDFRVLEALADGVPGRSPEATYGYLAQAAGLVAGIHEEATCDAVAARLEAALAAAKTPTDRRALHLLLSAVRTRAGQVPRADPKHARLAVAALERAFDGGLVEGERVLLARHLAALGRPADAALRAARTARLESLLAGAEGPMERLLVGHALATALWQDGRRDEATDRLQALLADVRVASGGTLPPETDGLYDALLGWWTEAGRLRPAEDRLRADLAAEVASGRREAVRMRLFALYATAAGKRAALSLGSGPQLLAAAAAEMERYLFEGPAVFQTAVAGHHAQLHLQAARGGGLAAAAAAYEEFARGRLPEVASRSPLEAPELLAQVVGPLQELRGPLAPLALLLDRVLSEPAWYARIGQDAWSRFASSMAHWRQEAGRIGELEARLLPLVLARLEAELGAMDEEGGAFWRPHGTFWHEHAREFAAVAGRVAELRGAEPSVALYVAQYQRQGLRLSREAVATLEAALGRGEAPENLRRTLVAWLREDRRFAEAWPHLERLLAERPDNRSYVAWGAQVLHELRRDPEALALLQGAVARWKERKAWDAGAAAAMAQAAFDAGIPREAATWVEEALRLRREAGGPSGPDRLLAAWYALLARARSSLGETDAAVRAAAAAVVAWGRDAESRGKALEALRHVLATAKDRDAWLARYDAEVQATGLDAPTIRKALGQVLLEQGAFARAATQLRAARELQPADAETHALLVRALDAQGDGPGAVEALLASVRLAPRNLDAYTDLALRWAKQGDAALAERARTNLVEAMPAEPDGWRALARIREANGRWALAAACWERVAAVRPLEPEGFLALARARIESGDAAGARRTLDHLMATTWDARFGDVRAEAAGLLQRLR